jgi:hypothetical protein
MISETTTVADRGATVIRHGATGGRNRGVRGPYVVGPPRYRFDRGGREHAGGDQAATVRHDVPEYGRAYAWPSAPGGAWQSRSECVAPEGTEPAHARGELDAGREVSPVSVAYW